MQTFLITSIIFYSLLILTQTLNFCQTTSSKITIHTLPNQIQQLPLSQIARGYNLQFSSSSNLIQIHQPYIANQKKMPIQPEYTLVTSNTHNGNIDQIPKKTMLALANNNQIAIWFSQFQTNDQPIIQNLRYLTIDTFNNCYSSLIFSQNLDVIIDCDQKQQTQNYSNLLCIIPNQNNPKCKTFNSPIKTGTRKSIIYQTQQQTFLLSATLTNNLPSELQNQTFINVYSISLENIQKNITINNEILKLKTLSISDIDLVKIDNLTYILLTDPYQGLIFFTLSSDGQISSKINIITVFAKPTQFDQSPQGSWFVANGQFIVGGNYQTTQNRYLITKFYDTQVTDNIAQDLQVSHNLIIMRTTKNQLNVYNRNNTQLKYLLNKQQISKSTTFILSKYQPKFYLINTTSLFSIQVTNGIIFVKQVIQDTDITITANSNSATCYFVISVKLIKNQTAIYENKPLQNLKISPNQQNQITLSQYFTGNNLKYSIPNSSKQLTYTLNHINKLNLTTNSHNQQFIQSHTLQIDINMYWLVKIFTQNMRFYICRRQQTSFTCTEDPQQSIQIVRKPYVVASGFQDYRAYFIWNDGESEIFYWKFLGKTLYTVQNISTYLPEPRISRIVMGSQYTAILQKQNNRISFIQSFSDFKIFPITYKDLTQKQLQIIGGYFYPRDIFPTSDPNIFYLKLTNSLARIFYYNGKIQILDIKTGKQGLTSDQWQAIIGHHTILIATETSLEQYSIIENKKLHTISPISLILPAKYSNTTNTAYFKQNDGNLQLIQLGLSSFNSFYYKIQLNQTNELKTWGLSGSYLTIGQNNLYYIYQKPTLILSTPNTNSSSQNLKISIKIQNTQGNTKTNSQNITIFKISTKISNKNITSNGLQLPQSATNKTIQLLLTNYFTGPISTYSLTCPYCQDQKIQLIKPFSIAYDLSKYQGYFSVIKLSDNYFIIGYQSQIKIINDQGLQITSLNTNAKHCRSMSISGNNLFAFYDLSQQYIYHIQISLKPTPTLKLINKYLIPQSQLSPYPFEIASYITSNNTLYIAIHYYNPYYPQDSTTNIKIFILSNSLNQIAIIDSNTFNLDQFQTINSMAIFQNLLFFTIGKIGIGYLDLTTPQNIKIFNLKVKQQFNKILTNTQFLRITIDQKNTNSTSLTTLITTSNSFSFLTKFKIEQNKITQFHIISTYNPYGSQKHINWALISSQYILQAFYNPNIQSQTIALYKKSNNNTTPIDFFIAHQILKVAQFIPLSVILHETHPLFLINTQRKPMILNITNSFSLLCNYQKPSNFTNIKITAQNAQSTTSLQIKVQFDGIKPDDDDNSGLKWYIYLIIIVSVIILAIVGFLTAKKIKNKKQNKKVSLFSSKEDINQDI